MEKKLTSTTTTICTPTIHDLLLALSRDGETRRRQVVVCDRSDSGGKQHLEERARAPNPPRYLTTSTKNSPLAAIPSDLPCWTSRGNASLAKSIEGQLGLGLGRHLGNLCTRAIGSRVARRFAWLHLCQHSGTSEKTTSKSLETISS